MRVAHIIKVTRISGAERHILILLEALRGKDIDAHLIILVENGKPMDAMLAEAQDRGIPVRRLLIRRDVDLSLIAKIRRALQEIQPELLHTHLIHADIYGPFAAKFAGPRAIVSTRHNDDPFRSHPLWRRFNRLTSRMTIGRIAISEAIKTFMVDVEGLPENTIDVVHYGMDHRWISAEEIKQARHNLRVELGLASDALLVGMVCRVVEQKGIPYALRAMRQIRGRFPNAHLVIAGDGELRPRLEAQARELRIDDRAHWLGWRADAADLIAAFDLLLMPSLWEGFGLVLLEAMSKRAPVIASRVSAIPEVVAHGETGLLTEPRDVAGLADALCKLLEDRALRQHMGLLGAARLEERFSIERMTDGTIAVYKKRLRG